MSTVAPLVPLRGIVPEKVVLSTALDPFLPLKALASYAGLSVRTLHNLIAAPVNPLPHFRIGGKILVRRSDYDQWAAQHRRVGVSVEDLVERHHEWERRRKAGKRGEPTEHMKPTPSARRRAPVRSRQENENTPSDLPGASSPAA